MGPFSCLVVSSRLSSSRLVDAAEDGYRFGLRLGLRVGAENEWNEKMK